MFEFIAPIAGPILGSIIGREAGRGDRDAANRAAANAVDAIRNLQIPDIEKQKLMIELPQLMGEYFPEEEVAMALGPSRMEEISIDPRLKEAQMRALESLAEIGEGGMNAQDRLLMNQLRREVAGQEQAEQAAILQNLAQRGQAGSGTELAQRMLASQKGADRASQESDRIAAMAQQRALQAISDAGALGGRIRSQEFGEQTDVARAADEISKFNLANQLEIQRRNVGARNLAEQARLGDKQRMHELQVRLRNEQNKYNKELLQKQYENELRKASLLTGAYGTQAERYGKSAAETGQMWKDIGTGVGGIAGSLGKDDLDI